MIKQGGGFYSFKIFSLYPKLVNLITTKSSGNFISIKHNDFRPLEILRRFGVDPKKIVLAEQVHGSKADWVRDVHAKQKMPGADALITDQKSLFLTIIVADCVPVFLYDPIRGYLACFHSGWQGALQKISLKVVGEFLKKGSKRESILVGIGPSICFEHYDIPESRANLFNIAFGKDKVTKLVGGKIHLDVSAATKIPLLEFGIPEQNIEEAGICTYERSEEFYSFRRDKSLVGENAAIIGLKG